MNIAFTMSVSINGEFVLKKGDETNQIPSDISVRGVAFWPEKDTDYPEYYIKGIHSRSGYVKSESEMPVHTIEGITDDVSIFCYIKTTSAVTFNIEVKGKI